MPIDLSEFGVSQPDIDIADYNLSIFQTYHPGVLIHAESVDRFVYIYYYNNGQRINLMLLRVIVPGALDGKNTKI